MAEDFNGNVFVTDKTGAAKDNITYDSAGDAYLNGGPEGKNGSGLAPGTYYFQVTDPNGNMLLSTDNAECRQLTVAKNGRFAGAAGPASCRHANGTPAQQSTPVQLAPFSPAPNDGDEYTVWLIRQTGSTSISQSDPKVINFTRANSTKDNFKVKRSPVVPVGSCQPSNAISVLAVEKQVFSFIPKGSWMLSAGGGQKDVGVVNVEPYGVPLGRIPTQKPVSSCASSSLTAQTVCTTNDQDVYVFSPPAMAPSTLQSSASGTSLFFGGSCMTCGVTMDAVHNKGMLSLSLAVPPPNTPQTSLATSGFQYVDLGSKPRPETAFRSEAPPAFNPGGEISKGILIDPIRNWILSPNESGNYEIIKVRSQKDDDEHKNDKDDDKNNNGDHDRHDDTANDDHGDKDHGDKDDKTQLAFFENNSINDPVSQFPASFASAGEDCRTGIALATVEFSDPSEVYVADLTRAQWTPGSPGSWQAPSNFQPLTGSSFPSGPNGIAVAQGTSIGLVAGMSNDSITAIKLPAMSGPGTTPAITDWVTCRLPGITGNAPHTLNAYKSPNSGHAMAVVGNLTATALWRVDLTQMLNLPRTAHTCNSVFLPPDVLSTIAVP